MEDVKESNWKKGIIISPGFSFKPRPHRSSYNINVNAQQTWTVATIFPLSIFFCIMAYEMSPQNRRPSPHMTTTSFIDNYSVNVTEQDFKIIGTCIWLFETCSHLHTCLQQRKKCQFIYFCNHTRKCSFNITNVASENQ